MNVLLERFAYTPHGVFGKIILPDFECYTIERPWLNNKVEVSCIPEGDYELKLGVYNRGGYPSYEVLDVPGRTHIKIHVGNTIDDIVGCISPGKSLGFLKGKWAVTSSRDAFDEFMEHMDGAQHGQIKIYQYMP